MSEANRHTATATVAGEGGHALAAPRYELIPLRGMREQAQALPHGATVTVTCSPRHGIERTLEAAEALAADGFHSVPHLAARLVRDRAHLQAILDRIAAAGIGDCFVVGGDTQQPVGAFAGGTELIETITEMAPRPRRLGVPVYPEGHHSLDDTHLDAALAAKAKIADYAVTQLCFEAEPLLAWLRGQRERGFGLPVYAGLPGVLDRKRMLTLAMRLGLGPSTRVLRRQHGLVGRLMHSSVYRADELIWSLVPAVDDPVSGLAGFHVYTFNAVAETHAWLREMYTAYCRWYGIDMETSAAVAAPAEQLG